MPRSVESADEVLESGYANHPVLCSGQLGDVDR